MCVLRFFSRCVEFPKKEPVSQQGFISIEDVIISFWSCLWLLLFILFCFFLLFRLAFEQDIERGNTDGLGDCQSKQSFYLCLPCVTVSYWMPQITITCQAFFCSYTSHNRDSNVMQVQKKNCCLNVFEENGPVHVIYMNTGLQSGCIMRKAQL